MVLSSSVPLLRADAAVSSSTLNRDWRRGEVFRVLRGVYAPADEWRKAPPWERYLTKVHAFSLSHPGSIFSHDSAAALHGIFIGRPSHPIHVIDPEGTGRLVSGARVHASRDIRGIEEGSGILLTSVPETIVDLARTRPPAIGRAYADSLLRAEPALTADHLRAINETRLSSRNRRHARWALDRATGIPESVLESVSLAVIEWAGFELPELQREFSFAGHRDRGDFFWPSVGVLGEADGQMKYGSLALSPEAAIRREKDRESRLRQQVRSVVRWGWREAVTTPTLLIDILARAGVRRPFPADPAMLATLPFPFAETATASRD